MDKEAALSRENRCGFLITYGKQRVNLRNMEKRVAQSYEFFES